MRKLLLALTVVAMLAIPSAAPGKFDSYPVDRCGINAFQPQEILTPTRRLPIVVSGYAINKCYFRPLKISTLVCLVRYPRPTTLNTRPMVRQCESGSLPLSANLYTDVAHACKGWTKLPGYWRTEAFGTVTTTSGVYNSNKWDVSVWRASTCL
jgi:hypothetical protein